jgi:hypothetical protein
MFQKLFKKAEGPAAPSASGAVKADSVQHGNISQTAQRRFAKGVDFNSNICSSFFPRHL